MTEMVVAHHRSVGLPSEDEAARYYRLADKVARTEMVPGDLRGKPDMVLATMLAGRELGLGPLESCRVFYVVDGKPSESAELLHTLALRAGHDIYVAESTRDGCTVMARHRDWPADRKHRDITFDVEDAATAELVSHVCADQWPRHQTEQVTKSGRNGNYTVTACVADDRGVRCKDNYRKYGRAMFRSRAITEAVRSVCPEVTVGATYTAEELGAEVTGEHGTPAGRDEAEWSQPLADPEPTEDDPTAEDDDDVVDAEIVDDPLDTMPCQATPPGRDYPTCELAEGHDGDHEAGRAHWRDPVEDTPDEAGPVDVCDICGEPEDGHTHDESSGTQAGAPAAGTSPGERDASPSPGADGGGEGDGPDREAPAPAERETDVDGSPSADNDGPDDQEGDHVDDGAVTPPDGDGGAEEGPSSPAPNPCKTCGPDPRTQPCPDCPSDDDGELPWQRADRLEISAADQMLKLRDLAKPIKATVPARRHYVGTGKCHPGLTDAFVAWLDEVEEGLSQKVGA